MNNNLSPTFEALGFDVLLLLLPPKRESTIPETNVGRTSRMKLYFRRMLTVVRLYRDTGQA